MKDWLEKNWDYLSVALFLSLVTSTVIGLRRDDQQQQLRSTDINRFAFPGGSDIPLTPLESVNLEYNTTAQRGYKI